MNIEELIEEIYKRYNQAKASEVIEKLAKKMAEGKGTYKDLYEYANSLGDGLGKILLETIASLDFEEAGNFIPILKQYADDITENGILIQQAKNSKAKINIKPQTALFETQKADGLIRNIMLTKNASNEVSNFGMKLVDSTIKNNADILRKAGYETLVIREYDNVGLHRKTKWAETCSWCLERAGAYDYDKVKETGNKVWERHVGCTCSIDFENKGITKKVLNYKKVIKA